MSKIKIFGLGGLDENGKNCYVIEINDNIFVFDCGLKYATGNLLGIDYIIPDFSYLVKNKKRVKGVFITHGHQENMGSVGDLLAQIPNIKIYATKFTKFCLMEDGVKEENIIEIEPHKKITFDELSIFPISVSHSAPDAVMYVINTSDGAICYTGDFLIDPSMSGAYDSDLGKIAYIGKQGVLCMLCESIFAEKNGHTSPKHKLEPFFKNVIKHNQKRIIFSVLSDHLYTINEIFNSAASTHRKVIIMGKKLQNVINYSVKNKYLVIEENQIGDLSNLKDDNAIILISDDRQSPYANISKILNNYDKYIELLPTDTVVFAEPKYDSSEKLFVKIVNELAKFGCNVVDIPKEYSILQHASKEDLMLMIKLINPKYYIPVKGDYRYMVGNADVASELGIPSENIILKQNGDVITFENRTLVDKIERINVDDIFIDGKSNDDIGDLVIKDREILSENGIVLVSATISKKEKVIIGGPEIITRGFIYVKDSKSMIEEIEKICEGIINNNITPNYVDYNLIKVQIREELGKYLYFETECKPMIIAVIQEV
ncbi:MAG: ribonuclease J [Mollicutes bacterium]|nr:ribonuclease J [Mollicutes bacterium]